MPRHKPSLPRLSRKAHSAARLILAASALSMLAFWGAYAQQTGNLRGAIPGEADAPLARTAPDDGLDADATAAPGGDDASLFDDPIGEDGEIFGEPARPPARPPSTRRQRAAAAAEPADPEQATLPNGAGARGREADPEEPATVNGRTLRERTDTADTADEDAGRAQQALAVDALPRGNAAETNPYDAAGIRAGGFVLRPSVETGLTASSNAARTADGSSGVLSETTLRLNARSDWSEHTATLDGFGTFRRSLTGADEVSDVESGVNAALQLDLGSDWQARFGLSYSAEPEAASSQDAISDAEEQPEDQELEVEAGLDKEVGKIRLGATASVERNWYGQAELGGGGTADQSARDSTLGLLKLRTGYEVSPAVTPFVEAEVGRRAYDDVDVSASRVGLRAGVALDLREKLSGEVSAGWLRESFDDSDLEAVGGPSLLAALRWSPLRDTVVALNASTSVESSATAGGGSSLVQDLRLEVERTLRANLTAEAGLGASLRDYVGTDGQDVTLIADISATWWLNRWFGLSGRLRHERLDSSQPERDYRENSVFVGTRLQY